MDVAQLSRDVSVWPVDGLMTASLRSVVIPNRAALPRIAYPYVSVRAPNFNTSVPSLKVDLRLPCHSIPTRNLQYMRSVFVINVDNTWRHCTYNHCWHQKPVNLSQHSPFNFGIQRPCLIVDNVQSRSNIAWFLIDCLMTAGFYGCHCDLCRFPKPAMNFRSSMTITSCVWFVASRACRTNSSSLSNKKEKRWIAYACNSLMVWSILPGIPGSA